MREIHRQSEKKKNNSTSISYATSNDNTNAIEANNINDNIHAVSQTESIIGSTEEINEAITIPTQNDI